MKKDSPASEISNILNRMSVDAREVGVELSTDHRYLSNKAFTMFLHLAGELARDFEKGYYDERNQYACKCSKIIIDTLEKENLYDKKFEHILYDEILPKCYE